MFTSHIAINCNATALRSHPILLAPPSLHHTTPHPLLPPLLRRDPAITVFVEHLEEKGKIPGGRFIIQNLGAGGLFVKAEAVEAIQEQIDLMLDRDIFGDNPKEAAQATQPTKRSSKKSA